MTSSIGVPEMLISRIEHFFMMKSMNSFTDILVKSISKLAKYSSDFKIFTPEREKLLKGFSNLTEIILLFKYSLFKLSTSPS